MNCRIKDFLFLMLTITLIFNNIPQCIQINFLGGPIGNKLVFYPFVICLGYSIYCQYRSENILKNYKIFLKYICTYLFIILTSFIIGLNSYPYWDDILLGPINQIEKLPAIVAFCQKYGLNIDIKFLTEVWMIARQVKNIFWEVLWCLSGSYIIYCWYNDDWSKCLKLILRGCLISLVVIVIYSFVEVLYLMHSNYAAVILQEINPYVHVIKENNTWWPPLLWKGQLRSVFAEPSYFGIYAAFAMPFLWYQYLLRKQKLYIGLITIFSIFLFLTKARTAFLLHVGELFLLGSFTLIYLLNKEYIKRITIIFVCSFVAFLGSNLIITNFIDKPIEKVATKQFIAKYVDDNAESLFNPDRRSNRARYSIMEADLKVGLDNPLFGVGMGLRNNYVQNYLSDKGKRNTEIKMWIANKEKLGTLRFIFPKLGEYTSRFAETGILGLICFLVPPFYLLYNIFKKLSFLSMKERLPYIMYVISLLGIMVSGIGDTLNITYCYWVLLGLGYAMCFGECKNEESGGQ